MVEEEAVESCVGKVASRLLLRAPQGVCSSRSQLLSPPGSQLASVPMCWQSIGHVSCILIRLYLLGEETRLQMAFFPGRGEWGLPGGNHSQLLEQIPTVISS